MSTANVKQKRNTKKHRDDCKSRDNFQDDIHLHLKEGKQAKEARNHIMSNIFISLPS